MHRMCRFYIAAGYQCPIIPMCWSLGDATIILLCARKVAFGKTMCSFLSHPRKECNNRQSVVIISEESYPDVNNKVVCFYPGFPK
jgi:lipoate synthase